MAQALKLADWAETERAAREEAEREREREVCQLRTQVLEMVDCISHTRAFNDWLLMVGWKHNATDTDMVMAYLADRPNL